MGFLFILKRIGFFFIDNWKIVLPVIGGIILIVFVFKACNKPPKLDEAAIKKAQDAIAVQDRKAMLEVLAESDAKEAQIDENLANAKVEKIKAIHEARKNAEAMTNEELAAELERRSQQ